MGESRADAILVERLSFGFDGNPGRPVLDDLSLAVGENEFAAILGRNGSGKTTLLKNITGLLRPQGGRILVRGRDGAGMSVAEIAGEIGYVTQDSDNQLFEQTVYDEVAFALRRVRRKPGGGWEVRRRVGEALETMGLWERRDAFPPALCKADRVRTVFAAVLAMGARILVLDEPLAGQDRAGSRTMMGTLADLHRKGYTVILVTHNIRVAAEYAQRLVVIDSGRVHMDGTPAELFERDLELARAGILLPRVSGLSRKLRGRIPIERTAVSPMELANTLTALSLDARVHKR